MFGASKRSRARPSKKVLAWSLIVVAAAAYLGYLLFGSVLTWVLAGGAVVSLIPSTWRWRSLKAKLPEPHGRGAVASMDLESAQRIGLILVGGGAVFFVALFGSVFFLPVYSFFFVLFSLIIGLPLSQVAFYALVVGFEARTSCSVFLVTDEGQRGGEEVLLKSAEMVPRAQ